MVNHRLILRVYKLLCFLLFLALSTNVNAQATGIYHLDVYPADGTSSNPNTQTVFLCPDQVYSFYFNIPYGAIDFQTVQIGMFKVFDQGGPNEEAQLIDGNSSFPLVTMTTDPWISYSNGAPNTAFTVTDVGVKFRFDKTPPNFSYRICFRALYRNGFNGNVSVETMCWQIFTKSSPINTLSGPTQIGCNSGPVTYCASPNNYPGYKWTLPPGWTVIGSSTGSCITVQPSPCGGGVISVKGKIDGCSDSTYGFSKTLNVGRPAICPGEFAKLVRPISCDGLIPAHIEVHNPLPGTNTYEWFKDGQSIGIGTNLTSMNNLGPGTYAVVMTTAAGCKYRNEFVVTDPANDPPISATFTFRCVLDKFGQRYVRITPVVQGGFPLRRPIDNGPYYLVDWSGPPAQSNLDMNASGGDFGVAPGATVTFTFKDWRGCVKTYTVTAPICPSQDPTGGGGGHQLSSSPNPFQNSVTVTVTKDATVPAIPVKFDIYDHLGTKVYTTNFGMQSSTSGSYLLDLSALPADTYHLLLNDGDAYMNMLKY